VTNPAAHDFEYPAALYELVHRGTAGDLSFYSRECADARRVLELGCGYGRVLSALCERTDLELTGLDRNPELLARARARLPERVVLVHADMTRFELPGPGFDRILIPHSGVYCLEDDDACIACFRACARHLAPAGRLVFDAYAADGFHAEQDPADHSDERLDPVVSVEHEGICYDVFERSLWRRQLQRLDVTYEYVPREGGDAAMGRLVHHYLLLEQISPLLRRAGLDLVSLAGDWRGRPAEPDDDMWVATAVLAGDG
jgi:SAM-dependent methyltransferase